MTSEAEGRLAQILQRELGANDVRFVPEGRAPEPSASVLVCAVEGGPSVVAMFDEAPADHEAKLRRMEMIIDSFADLLTASAVEAARPRSATPARSLAGELTALAGRAGAMAAIVVDAASPVVWGASDLYDAPDDDAEESDVARLYRKAAHVGLRFDALVSTPLLDTEGTHEGEDGSADEESGPQEDDLTQDERAELWRRVLLVRNALAAVRALPEVASLHKGEHLHASVRAPELSYVARSFATIYLLLLVFERPFDELRAERSVTHALPTIERLVLALPPREPTPPMAGVGVMRMRRR